MADTYIVVNVFVDWVRGFTCELAKDGEHYGSFSVVHREAIPPAVGEEIHIEGDVGHGGFCAKWKTGVLQDGCWTPRPPWDCETVTRKLKKAARLVLRAGMTREHLDAAEDLRVIIEQMKAESQ